ncbi:MAG: putative Sco1/SenC family protein [Frankiales bacterium]|jgi:protein SCO1/2|nr:putative Sco1/SenC family protein [Frankiales bacterium]
MTRRAAAALGLAVGLLLTGCAGTAAPEAAPAAEFHGVEPEPVPARPSFVLRTTAGERYDFAERTGGRPTLLYFGYTNCPDECPTAMADIAAALRSTPAELRDEVEVVFVTTDPARDTPPILREWLDKFSQEYVGLVGTQAEVDAAQVATGIAAAKKGGAVETLPGRPNEHVHKPGTAPHTHDRPLGYGVGHANVIFGFDTRDRLPVLYPGGVRPSDIAADLPLLAQTQGDPS